MDAPCATTLVRGVLIDRAERYGIFQRGGALSVISSVIRETRAQADTISAGTGIYLSGGVQAVLGLVSIDRGESAALVATGADTQVYGNGVSVTGTGINPHFRDQLDDLSYAGFAAVEAKNGALLLMEYSHLNDNERSGLLVHDGAQAHFRYAIISFTRTIEEEGLLRPLGGNNVLVVGATLEINNFTLSHAELAGLSALDAYVTLSDGTVSHSEIGVHVDPPDDPDYVALACLQDQVSYEHNARTIDSFILPVPDPCVDCPAPGAGCRTVTFFCEWCGGGL
jgi:hypothetical protein